MGAGAADDQTFSLVHNSGRTRRKPSGITDLRMEAAAGGAVTERHVAGLVHRDTSHPAIIRIRRISALLENRWRRAGSPNFVPTHTDARARSHAVTNHERFVITKIAIVEAVHQPIA